MLAPEIVLQVDEARSRQARRGRECRIYYTLTNHSSKPRQLALPLFASFNGAREVPFQVRVTPLTRLSEPIQVVITAIGVDLRRAYKVTLLPDFAISGYLILVGKGGTYILLPTGLYRVKLWYDSRPLSRMPYHEGLWLGITNTVEFKLRIVP